MSAATIIKSTDANVPVLSGTEGSLAALIRYIAPILGWEIMFDNGPVIVVRPQSYKGGHVLLYRFDDRAARGGEAPRIAEVRAYESMPDIDLGSGLVGPVYMHKSPMIGTTAQPYIIIGDSYGFYLFGNSAAVNNDLPVIPNYVGFGNALFPTDTPMCVCIGSSDSRSLSGGYSQLGLESTGVSASGPPTMKIHRNVDGQVNVSVFGRSSSPFAASSSNSILCSVSTKFTSEQSPSEKGMLPYPYKGSLVSAQYFLFSAGWTPQCSMPGFNAHAHRIPYYTPMSSDIPMFPVQISDGNRIYTSIQIVAHSQFFCTTGAILFEISEGFRP